MTSAATLQQLAARSERESEAILRATSTVTCHPALHCVSCPRAASAAIREPRSLPRQTTATDTANALLIREGPREVGAPVPPRCGERDSRLWRKIAGLIAVERNC